MNPSDADDPAKHPAVEPLHARDEEAPDDQTQTDDIDESFGTLGLEENLLKALVDSGYRAPTEIQTEAIPPLLQGRDLIGQAQTGTGKTAAYALPLLQRLSPEQKVQALVLTPTRELAIQVSNAVKTYGRHFKRLRVLPVYGGQAMSIQLGWLNKGVHVVVGTPGRILDHLGRGSLRFDAVHTVVLDEADEMLHMGFIDDVETILAQAPTDESVQISLFSATIPKEIRRIATKYLRDPVVAEVLQKTRTIAAVDQRFVVVHQTDKLEVLTRILEVEESGASLVFAATRVGCATLAEKLEERGIAAEALHGDMSQAQRELVVKRLRSGRTTVVVATDVAARGLDVDAITHVINFDAPRDPEIYLHRIGRTARAGRGGVAMIFVRPRERRFLNIIERYTRSKLTEMNPPSKAQVREARIAAFKADVKKAMSRKDLDFYANLAREIATEESCDVDRVAAALAVRLRKGLAPPKTEQASPQDDDGTAYLALSLGRWDGVRAGDVVGAIANEVGLAGKQIGPVLIYERHTLVGVPARSARHVMTELSSIRGRLVQIRHATDVERRRCESKSQRPSQGRRGGPPGLGKARYSPKKRRGAPTDRLRRGRGRGPMGKLSKKAKKQRPVASKKK